VFLEEGVRRGVCISHAEASHHSVAITRHYKIPPWHSWCHGMCYGDLHFVHRTRIFVYIHIIKIDPRLLLIFAASPNSSSDEIQPHTDTLISSNVA
jgi:hypothetical protein